MLRPLALVLVATLPTPTMADEVVVFAAASLKSALDQVAADFETATGHSVTVSYAGSNLLARQIVAGAPADVFLSAAASWMDEVQTAGLIVPGSRTDLVGNRLVLIAHGKAVAPVTIGPDLDLPALLGDGKLAMALVDAVPAGQYGKAALETLGLWAGVAPAVVQTDNVRAALALVGLGEASHGIVYASDAAAGDNVTVVGRFPADSHPPIRYPAALLTGAADAADAAFLAALASPEAGAHFAAQGFTLLTVP
jgi:molybdate transport system substrate-binding protein